MGKIKQTVNSSRFGILWDVPMVHGLRPLMMLLPSYPHSHQIAEPTKYCSPIKLLSLSPVPPFPSSGAHHLHLEDLCSFFKDLLVYVWLYTSSLNTLGLP